MLTAKKPFVGLDGRAPWSIAAEMTDSKISKPDDIRFPELQVKVRNLPKAQALSIMGDYNETVNKTNQLQLPPFKMRLGNIDSGRDDVCYYMRELSISKPPKVCQDKTVVGYSNYTQCRKSREKTFEQTISRDVTVIKENVKGFLVDRERKLRKSNAPRYIQLRKLGLDYLPIMEHVTSKHPPCHKLRRLTNSTAPPPRVPYEPASSSSEIFYVPKRLSHTIANTKPTQAIWLSSVKPNKKPRSEDVSKSKIPASVQPEYRDVDPARLHVLHAGYAFVKPLYRRNGMPIITLSHGTCSLHSETARAKEYARTLYPNFNWTVEKNERLFREIYLDAKPKHETTYVPSEHTLATTQPRLTHLHYTSPVPSEFFTFGIHDLENIPLSIKMDLKNFSNKNELPRAVLNNLAVLARGSYTPMSISPLKNPPPTSQAMHSLSNVVEDNDSGDEQDVNLTYTTRMSDQYARLVSQKDSHICVEIPDNLIKRRNPDNRLTLLSRTSVPEIHNLPGYVIVDGSEKRQSVEVTSSDQHLTVLDEKPEINVHVHNLKLSVNSTGRDSEMTGKTTQYTCATDELGEQMGRERSSNAEMEIDTKPEVKISNKDIVFISPAL